jgi:hypothetical protein
LGTYSPCGSSLTWQSIVRTWYTSLLSHDDLKPEGASPSGRPTDGAPHAPRSADWPQAPERGNCELRGRGTPGLTPNT